MSTNINIAKTKKIGNRDNETVRNEEADRLAINREMHRYYDENARDKEADRRAANRAIYRYYGG